MAATIVNDAIMVPADVIKQRLQVSQGKYRGVLDCIMQTWKREGLGAFYRQVGFVPRYLSGACLPPNPNFLSDFVQSSR